MRLIDANELQALFNDVSTSLLSEAELQKDAEHMVRASLMVTEMIQDAQTVDAVPVVRCRNCNYRQDGLYCRLRKVPVIVTNADFCSYGKRRKENG